MSDDQGVRGGMFQGAEFSVPDVAGRPLEQLLGVLWEDSNCERDSAQMGGSNELTLGSPYCFLLKVRGLPWQRFYFDAGLGFWGEWDTETLEEDLSSPTVDYVRKYSLEGRVIEHVVCGERQDQEGTIHIAIRLDDGSELVASIADSGDPDTEVEVRFFQVRDLRSIDEGAPDK